MSVIVNLVKRVYVPFEIDLKGNPTKRDDLPRFANIDDIRPFMDKNPLVHRRDGVPVHLQWIEHHEDWAIQEFYRGVGRAQWLLS